MMGPFERMVESRLTIVQAARKLALMGYELLGGEPFDLKSQTARYRVKFPNGSVQVLTSSEIKGIVAA